MATNRVEPAADTNPQPETEEPPKKGKAKLTKEERAERAKQRKLLKKQKALDDKKQQFRDYLDRELKYTDVTYQRAAADWEAMCANIKLEDLRADMTEIWQGLNRAFGIKNHTINRLLGELDIAEEQYRRTFSKHAEILDYLMNLFHLMVSITRTAYEEDATNLVAEFQQDVAEKEEIHKSRKTYYENVLHATNLMTANILQKMEANFSLRVNEMAGTHIAKRFYLRDITVRKMEKLHEHMEKIIADLQGDALNPKREQLYNAYVQRHEQAVREVQLFEDAATNIQQVIMAHQTKLTESETKAEQEIVKLRNDRSYFVEHYWQLKQRFKDSQKGHDGVLKTLALESKRTIMDLKKIEKYGELLLGLLACCRKLQTEKEKVAPWTREFQNFPAENVKQVDESVDNIVENLRPLEYFWNLVGQARTHVLCLREEKQVLEKENENLRQILKSYCEMQAYNKIICSLQISPFPTSSIPVQEASLMPQLKGKSKNKKYVPIKK